MQLFGNEQDLDNFAYFAADQKQDCIILLQNFPRVKIPVFFKHELDDNLKDSRISDTVCFRKLSANLIPNPQVWATRNRVKMEEDFPDQMMACYQYVKSKRDSFTKQTFNETVRLMCAEARRIVKRISTQTKGSENSLNDG